MAIELASPNYKDHKLAFGSRRMHKGLNTTVRKGVKWSQEMTPGDSIFLVDTTGQPIGPARVVFAEAFDVNKFHDNVGYLLKFEHDPRCRNWTGLTTALNDAYGAGSWGPIVTVIGFWVD